MEIHKKNFLKALTSDWSFFNPEFVKFLFFITNENVNWTERILEELDNNEDFQTDIEVFGFEDGMKNLLKQVHCAEHQTMGFFGVLWNDELFENVCLKFNRDMEIPSIH